MARPLRKMAALVGGVVISLPMLSGVGAAQAPRVSASSGAWLASASVENSRIGPIANYVETLNKIGTYGSLMMAAEYATAVNAPRPLVVTTPLRRSSSVVTVPNASSGPHSDAWWHGVSICEQGGRNSPFFGYFSIMDGSAGGRSWSDQVSMANAIIARAGDSAWASSCVRAGYAASPGG